MLKKRRHKLLHLVPHPRFGSDIQISAYSVDPATVRNSYCGYSRGTIFPETAIPADLKKQNFPTMPRCWYVDILKQCRDCGRNFIFYAVEQKHWYEVLRFNIDADCVRCSECRKTDQTLQRRFQRFSRAIGRNELSDVEFAVLIRDAIFVWRNGLMKKREKLNRIRNQAKRRLPNHPATLEINQFVEELITS
jgi:hypothetical protein